MDNQQFYNLNSNQLQVILSGLLGDGHIPTVPDSQKNSKFITSCIYEEYILYKKQLLGELALNHTSILNMGFKQNLIYKLPTKSLPIFKELKKLGLQEILDKLKPLGIAMWFYDDGSLHKTKLFYNLNTHKYSYEEHKNILIPYFQKLGLNPILAFDVKKDGRSFCYLRFNKFGGAFNIARLLQKYPVRCFDYKVWNSETILLWSKLQMQLKSEGKEVSKKEFSNLISKLEKESSL